MKNFVDKRGNNNDPLLKKKNTKTKKLRKFQEGSQKKTKNGE